MLFSNVLIKIIKKFEFNKKIFLKNSVDGSQFPVGFYKLMVHLDLI